MGNECDAYEILIGPIEQKMIRSIWRIVLNKAGVGEFRFGAVQGNMDYWVQVVNGKKRAEFSYYSSHYSTIAPATLENLR